MADDIRKKTPQASSSNNAAVFSRIVDILDEARRTASRTVNNAMVVAYWLIGREIVEEEQKGQERAEYGQGSHRGFVAKADSALWQRVLPGDFVEYAKFLSII